MHELSIASAILEAAQREAALHQNAPLQKIAVRLGELAAVDPEALRFSFEMITKATEFEAVELELEFVPRTNRCADCGSDFVVKDFEFRCPSCGGVNTSFLRGDELELAYLELQS
ncbi:MAG TPA: hydrogenase maturation nickel metallochaperone HypA [Candidatus Angelobacter sp.]